MTKPAQNERALGIIIRFRKISTNTNKMKITITTKAITDKPSYLATFDSIFT